MAGMLSPALQTLPEAGWIAVFAASAAWFGLTTGRLVRQRGVGAMDDDGLHHVSHYAVHTLMALAMLYMFLVPDGARAMAVRAGSGSPAPSYLVVPFLIVVILLGSAAWEIDRTYQYLHSDTLAGGTDAASPHTGPRELPLWRAPRVEATCHVAMCITMAYALILMS